MVGEYESKGIRVDITMEPGTKRTRNSLEAVLSRLADRYFGLMFEALHIDNMVSALVTHSA